MSNKQLSRAWNTELVHARLVESGVIGSFAAFDHIDSTNRHLADLAQQMAAPTTDDSRSRSTSELVDLAVVVADEQSSGRGRLGRQWESPHGEAILASVWLDCPDVPRASHHHVTLMLGLSVCSAVRSLGLPATVKWPNDVLLGGAAAGKLCGILAQAVPQAGGVVVGFGLNVETTSGDLPSGAASLHVAGVQVSREEVLSLVLEHFSAKYRQWCASRGNATQVGLWTDLARCCSTLGAAVRAELPGDGQVLGTAVDFDSAGSLVIVTDDGDRVTVSAGDIIHLRPQ